MQDFIQIKAGQKNLTRQEITYRSIKRAKSDKWLSKDRLWNFVFWFGMSVGLAITLSVSKAAQQEYKLGTILIWATLIGVPLLVRHFSKTNFVKDNLFLNKEGFLLTKEQMPYSCAFTVFAGIGVAFIVAECFLPKGYSNFFTNFILSVCLFSVISLYFIVKNCPISILFNYKFWSVALRQGAQSTSNNAYYSRVRNNAIFTGRPENVYIDYKRH